MGDVPGAEAEEIVVLEVTTVTYTPWGRVSEYLEGLDGIKE